MKEGYYFPHFQDARRDIKILRVRRDLGIEGYGIYFMILEILREQSDFCFPIDDIEVLVKEIDTTKAKVQAVIEGYDLFQLEEKENGKVFFSPKQIQYLLPYIQKKEQAKLANIKSNLARKEKLQKQVNQLSLGDLTLHNSNSVNFSVLDSTSQTKLEEKKTKEIKETTGSSVARSSSAPEDIFFTWLKNKSVGKDNPSAYAAFITKKFNSGDDGLREEFELFKKFQTLAEAKSVTEISVKGKAIHTTSGIQELLGAESCTEGFKIYFKEGGFAIVASLDDLPFYEGEY